MSCSPSSATARTSGLPRSKSAPGDTLLLEGTWGALDEHLGDPDVLVVDSPDSVRRQVIPLGQGAKRTLVVVGGLIVLLASGAVPAAVAGVLAAGAMVVLGVVRSERAHRSIDWNTVILLGGLIPLSTAIQSTGAAADIAGGLVDTVGSAGPYAFLIGLFVITTLFSQMISNTATALIMIPIALSAAAELDISARPVLMSLAVTCAAAFITPIATPANLMVQRPGGYEFGDYWKLGLPMLALFFVVAVLLVPAIWSF